MKSKIFFSTIFIAALLITACAPPPPALVTPAGSAETTHVQLGLGYIPSVQFAPFYVAIDQGYFADENIEVELEHGFETDFLKLLGTNERQFIIASGEQVILGRAQGLPVTYAGTWYQKFPVVIFAPADAGIKTPQDLIGKKVGIPGLYGASYIAWKGLIYATGIPEDQVQLESIGFTQASAVQAGVVDAANDYAANGPVQLQIGGEDVDVIVIDDYIKMPANGLVTNETMVAEQPALVESMARTMLRGIQFTLDHPDEAFEISLKYVPEAAPQREINRAIFDASLPYWTPPADRKPGYSDPSVWTTTAEFMYESGLVDTLVDTEGIWTNQFVETAGVK